MTYAHVLFSLVRVVHRTRSELGIVAFGAGRAARRPAEPPLLPEQRAEVASTIAQRKAEVLLRSVRCGAIRR